jgi:hypothetical protein
MSPPNIDQICEGGNVSSVILFEAAFGFVPSEK